MIAQTIGQKLPEGFQRAEFLVEKGIIDGVVERQELKETVWKLLNIHQDALQYIHYGDTQNVENLPEIRNSCGKAAGCDKKELTAWERWKSQGVRNVLQHFPMCSRSLMIFWNFTVTGRFGMTEQ